MLILMNEAHIRKTVEAEPYIEKNGHASRSLWIMFTRKGRVLVRTTPEGSRSVGFGNDTVGELPHTSGPLWDTIVHRGLKIISDQVRGVGCWEEDDISFIGFVSEPGLPAVGIVGVIEIPEGYDLEVANYAGTDAEMVDPNIWLKTESLPVDAWSRDVVRSLTLLLQDPSMESSVVTWKKIPGYAQYLAGSDGSIKNLKTEHISKGGDAGRYLKVSVYPDGEDKPRLEYLHILICKAYHGIPSDSQVVLHKNNIRKDCRPSNLKLGTQSENVKDAYDDGLIEGKGLK